MASVLSPVKPESFRKTIRRWGFNFFPAYFSTGAWLTYLSDDYQHVRLKLPLSWRTRNPFGTTFGGSMYAAIDPILVVMFVNILGKDYLVWDKAARVHFKRPGRETLFAEIKVTAAEVAVIKAELMVQKSVDRTYNIELVNKAGKVHAVIEKTLYIARKDRGKKDAEH